MAHPTPENTPPHFGVTLHLRDNESDPDARTARVIATHFTDLTEVGRIGLERGSRQDVFGHVTDVTEDSTGNIFVLDARMNEIKTFNASGRYIDVFGGPGLGPEELAAPRALSITDDGTQLLVADRGVVKILANDRGRLSYESSINTEVIIEGVCLLDSVVYVRGRRADSGLLIHTYDLDGRRGHSFGRSYSSTNPLVADELSRGPLICDPYTDTIVAILSNRLPLIQAYSSDGIVKWNVWIDDFAVMDIQERQGNGTSGVLFGTEVPQYDLWYSAFSFGEQPRGLVFQTVRMNEAEVTGEAFPTLARTYVLDGDSGKGSFVGRFPLLVGAGARGLYGLVDRPFPHLKVWSGSEEGD